MANTKDILRLLRDYESRNVTFMEPDGSWPVVGSYGKRDRGLAEAAAKLESKFSERGIPHDIKEYPNAGHSFLDDPKGPIGVLGTVLGSSSYEDKDAANARGRIRALFSRNLTE